MYRLARQRHQAGKDVQQVRMMEDKDGKVMTDEESVLRIWKEYNKELLKKTTRMLRKQGSPKRRFMDVVKEDMAEVEVTEEDTEVRNNWRRKIRCGDLWWQKPK